MPTDRGQAWREVASDPNNKRVREWQYEWLEATRHSRGVLSWEALLKSEAAGRRVLDIGFVEHDIAYMERDNWEHAKVAEVASHALGIDLHVKGIELARRRGYNVREFDATSPDYLGEKFDLVVIGDVIEHVRAPQDLLSFALRHTSETGSILLKTPNPFYIVHTIRALKSRHVLSNADHVAWIGPDQFRELAARSGARVSWYAGALEPSGRSVARVIKRAMARSKSIALWQSLIVKLAPISERSLH